MGKINRITATLDWIDELAKLGIKDQCFNLTIIHSQWIYWRMEVEVYKTHFDVMSEGSFRIRGAAGIYVRITSTLA